MRLGKLILAYREKHRLSQREFAKVIGVDQSVIFRIENRKPISDKHLIKLIIWAVEPCVSE